MAAVITHAGQVVATGQCGGEESSRPLHLHTHDFIGDRFSSRVGSLDNSSAIDHQ